MTPSKMIQMRSTSIIVGREVDTTSNSLRSLSLPEYDTLLHNVNISR